MATLVAVPVLLLSASAAPQTTFIGEPQMSKRPMDVEVTPNGKLAIVRGHAPGLIATDGLTVVDTATGVKLAKSSCVAAAGQGGYFYTSNDYQPSDSLRVTNSRAILVGARDTDSNGSHDRTYIDVLAFDMGTVPPTVTCLAHHEEGLPNQIAGWTNDVQITPDESFAIINSSNWIHVIDLSTGVIAQAFNIGGAPYEGPCFAGDSVDSIATTNSSAIVTTTRIGLVSPPYQFTRTWVYLIDLAVNPPTIALEHDLAGSLPIELQERDYWPHDVTITPNGSFAIVTANNATAVYDLDQHTFVARDLAAAGGTLNYRRRFFSDIVDSVETTDNWYVTISTDEQFYNPGGPICGNIPDYQSELWIVEVYDLPPNASPEMSPKRTFRLRNEPGFENPDFFANKCYPTYLGQIMITDKPHDMAIDETEAVAVIRTGSFNLVLTGLDDPDSQNIALLKLLDNMGVVNNYAPTNTFVSDSVLIPPGFIKLILEGQPGQGVFHYALTLGAQWKSVSNQLKPWVARVNVIDLKASPPAVVHTFTVEDPGSFPHIYPADLRVGPGAREFTLRCNAQPWDAGVSGGRDFVRFSLDPLSEIARIGASGRVWAVDSLEVGRFNATSVGEDKPSSTGFVHVVGVQ